MKSGTYKYINGKVIRVSDRIPNLNGLFSFNVPEPYYSHSLGRVIRSKAEKRYWMERENLIEWGPSDRITRKKPTPEQRKREIEETLNRHLTDLGVERIQLRDLHKQRKEKPWEQRTSEELRETSGLAIPGPAQTVTLT